MIAYEFIPYYWGDFEKYHIFATNFSYKIMSNLLIISSFNLNLKKKTKRKQPKRRLLKKAKPR